MGEGKCAALKKNWFVIMVIREPYEERLLLSTFISNLTGAHGP